MDSEPILKKPKGSIMLEHNLKSPLKSVDGRDTNDNSTSINKKEVMKEVVYNDDNFTIA